MFSIYSLCPPILAASVEFKAFQIKYMMRTTGSWRASTLLAVLLACALAPGAEAQSLLQSLFGNLFNSAPPKPVAPATPSVDVAPLRQGPNFSSRSDKAHRSYPGGVYRTLCVRTCDGYYFPISGSASRSKFHKDVDACSARCSGAKLYYLPRNSEDIAAMVDLSGRRYDELRTAFVYRKKLINGCACRPMPWSAAERARHNRYAYAAEILKQTEERAKRLHEGEIIAVAEKSERDNDEKPRDSAVLGELASNPGELNSAAAAGASEEAHSAYVSAVKVAIARGGTVSKTAMAEAEVAAENVSYAPRQIRKQYRSSAIKTGRVLKSRRVPAKSNGWPFAGGGRYTWPGDR